MISFVIPAHNEERHIGSTLEALKAAAREVGGSFEVIVVNDASTDRTVAIAEQHAVRVIDIHNRQIAAARNAGARVARGDFFFFVDADTQANPDAIRAGLHALHSGAVGGGCVFRFDGTLPMLARAFYPTAALFARLLKLVGGCFLFCTREGFEAVGGFCERYFAAEETAFIKALKRHGRFVVPHPTVLTSGRKWRTYPTGKMLREALRWIVCGPEFYQRREGLEIWYGERREDREADC